MPGPTWRDEQEILNAVFDSTNNALKIGQPGLNGGSLPPLYHVVTGAALFYETLGTISTSTPTNGDMRVTPFYFDRACSLDRIGMEVTGAGTSGSVLRMVVYSDTGDFYPSALLRDSVATDAVSIDGTSATAQTLTISALSVGPGWIWFGMAAQGAPSTQPTIRTVNNGAPYAIGSLTAPTANQSQFSGYSATGVTGAASPTFSATRASSVSVPKVWFRVT